MSNMGNATPETYRAHVYDTIWAALVKSDGTLRAVVDTPPSEITIYPNPTWSGLKYGNLMYDRMYRLASVIEPQQALGLLWVAAVPRGKAVIDSRGVYETLRNAGVPLSAMISPDLLAIAPKTGASGLVYLLPLTLEENELAGLRQLVNAKFPVVCLLPPDADALKGQLPAGVTIIEWPKALSPDEVSRLAGQIHTATGTVLRASEGVCLYGFRAQGRTFIVVQNMWPAARRVNVSFTAKASGLKQPVTAIDLNTNNKIPTAIAADNIIVDVPIAPWDATLIECVSNAE
jgi:hypothetical protein